MFETCTRLCLNVRMAIRVLTSDIINKIAAGEVIERPASIVKELLENAIDSGATKISITAENGGKSYIAIQDNGCGMSLADLQLCIQRHATSKLPTDNLFEISSLGFRGEAIPSIASIARLQITTNNGAECWSIDENGATKPATLPCGTKVEVSDIFFKIPARLKFLKSDAAENSNIIGVVQSLALSRPDIAFNFNNTINFSVAEKSSDKLFDRCGQIFGKDFTADKVIKVAENLALADGYNLKIFGYISRPSYGKSTSLYQHCFVNNRPVKDKLLASAIRIAYMDEIEKHTFPLCALFFEIENFALDVNVHPCKYEVRFKDANQIRGAIINVIKRAIKTASIQPVSIDIDSIIASETFSNSSGNNLSYDFKNSLVSEKLGENFNDFSQTNYEAFSENNCDENVFPLGYAILQIDNKYIISATSDGVIVIDAHAAHERILYEKFKNQIEKNSVPTQILLMPELISLTKNDIDLLMEHQADFTKLGLIFDTFSNDTLVVREVPAICDNIDLHGVIYNMLDEIKLLEKSKSFEEKMNHIIKTYACHTSIRAGKSLTIDEMNALLREIEKTENADHCNHGRPTYIKLKTSDMDKFFHR